jgi:lysophospholipase L1-like esterase
VRRASTNAALVVGSTVAAILVVELMIRLVGLPPEFGRLLSLYGMPTREVDGVVLWDTHEIERRLEEEDIERAVASDSFKILGLGDSIMFGVGLPAEQTYLARAGRILADNSRAPVEILNMAIPGYNTVQENAVHQEFGERVRPDLVIVHYWADDTRQYRVFGGYVVDFGDMLIDGGLVQALPLPHALNDFLLVNSRLYALLTHIVVANSRNTEPSDFQRAAAPMREIHDRAVATGGRLLVLASPGLDGERPYPNRDLFSLRKLGEGHGFEVIDLTEWLGDTDAASVAMDPVHFNAEGHRILAERLAAYLLERDLQDGARPIADRNGAAPGGR